MYTIGVDFGTESGRALLVDAETGQEIESASLSYPNGVITDKLPHRDEKLLPDWALQNPLDYIEVLKTTIPELLRRSGVPPESIAGIAIDFTSCTILPTTQNGVPLCTLDRWRDHPHAWVKLWKHHAAQPQADLLNEVARQRRESWLPYYGGKISSEWFFSKALQILQEAPEVYQATDRLIEAGDWVIWQLTGIESRNACAAGYKALAQNNQYPSQDYFAAVDPRFAEVVATKMSPNLAQAQLGSSVGGLIEQAAQWTGLRPGIAVAVANVDAHVTVPAVRVTQPGHMVMIMGTSTCHMLLSDEERLVEGISGVVRDGIIPGYYGYEAGQNGVGDIFEWFVENLISTEDQQAAQTQQLNIYQYLEAEIARQTPGSSGLLALDWWSGNRSTLMDANLTGLLLGATLATRSAEIYRALIESTAFGTRMIIDAFETQGIPIHELIAAGGLAEKNKVLIQIYADVTGRPIHLAGSPNASALGAAIHAAVAAKLYPDIRTAGDKMGSLKAEVIGPNIKNHLIYDRLYAEYKTLYDYFGRGTNDVMKRLKALKKEVT